MFLLNYSTCTSKKCITTITAVNYVQNTQTQTEQKGDRNYHSQLYTAILSNASITTKKTYNDQILCTLLFNAKTTVVTYYLLTKVWPNAKLSQTVTQLKLQWFRKITLTEQLTVSVELYNVLSNFQYSATNCQLYTLKRILSSNRRSSTQ